MLTLLLCCVAADGIGWAAREIPGTELSPDPRPTLLLQPPQGPLLLVQHAARMADGRPESLALKLEHWVAGTHRPGTDHRLGLPQAWVSAEPDRGFGQALLQQLSHVAANWPWRTLIVSGPEPDSDLQLHTIPGQDVVVALVSDELADLGGRVEFHVTLELTTVREITGPHETRRHTRVEYFAPALTADSSQPRRSRAVFAADGPLDDQVSTAATDLSQFLATFVARVSVPESLHPHNPTLGELGARPSCTECRGSDPVVYQQPGRVWVTVGKLSGTILALPLKSRQGPPLRTK